MSLPMGHCHQYTSRRACERKLAGYVARYGADRISATIESMGSLWLLTVTID